MHSIIVQTLVIGATLTFAARVLSAQTTLDQPASLLLYPDIELDTARGVDTVVQLSNTDPLNPVSVSCYYETADHSCGVTSFSLNLTSGQPVQWRAGTGLSTLPLSDKPGPTGQFNFPSFVPPVPNDPFSGSLLCFVVNTDSPPRPLPNDTLSGSATIERYQQSAQFDAAAYRAIGVGISANDNPPDDVLILGGPSGPYNACPLSLPAMHYFDGALDAPTSASSVSTRFVIIPCTQNLGGQPQRDHVIQYIVTNEFEQRVTVTRAQSGCEQAGNISTIDASAPERSVFHAAVQGTLTGQTRISADQGTSGILAVGAETQTEIAEPHLAHGAMFNLASQGLQPDPDFIILPAAAAIRVCSGDCDGNGAVSVDELIRCVNIALDPDLLGGCLACDTDRSGDITIDEIVVAAGKALAGCS